MPVQKNAPPETPPADPPETPPAADKPVTHGEIGSLMKEALTDFFGETPTPGSPPATPPTEPTSSKGIEEAAADILTKALEAIKPKTPPAATPPATPPVVEQTPREGGKFQRAMAGFFGWTE